MIKEILVQMQNLNFLKGLWAQIHWVFSNHKQFHTEILTCCQTVQWSGFFFFCSCTSKDKLEDVCSFSVVFFFNVPAHASSWKLCYKSRFLLYDLKTVLLLSCVPTNLNQGVKLVFLTIQDCISYLISLVCNMSMKIFYMKQAVYNFCVSY